jgi:hypothetical protein
MSKCCSGFANAQFSHPVNMLMFIPLFLRGKLGTEEPACAGRDERTVDSDVLPGHDSANS